MKGDLYDDQLDTRPGYRRAVVAPAWRRFPSPWRARARLALLVVVVEAVFHAVLHVVGR